MADLLVDIYKTKHLFSGLGQFSRNFAEALIAAPRSAQHLTFLRPPGFRLPEGPHHRQIEAALWMRWMPGLHRRYDLWHSLHQFPSHPPPKNSRTILTVHDLNFLTDKHPGKARRYLRVLQRNLDRAHSVTAISRATAHVLETHMDLRGKHVHVIHNGVRLEPCPDATRPAFLDDRPFFFSLSVFKESKNLHLLVPLMDHFPEHQLVIAGNHGTAYGERIERAVAEAGLSQRVHLPGIVDDRARYWLYHRCEAFIFPSAAEGFGLPVIEAMSAGAPVFINPIPVLLEIGGGLAYRLDELTPAGMAATIHEQLPLWRATGPAGKERLMAHAAKFRWSETIRRYQDLYEQVLAE